MRMPPTPQFDPLLPAKGIEKFIIYCYTAGLSENKLWKDFNIVNK